MPGPDDLDWYQQALLEQETRRAIVDLLEQAPGLNKQQVADRVGIDRRTLDHHLELLEFADLVIVRPGESDGERCCFLAWHDHLWEDEDKRVLYGQGPTRWVALLLVEKAPTRTAEIGDELGREPVTVREHLRKLRESGLAENVRSAGTVYHVPTAELEEWVEEFGEGYRRPWEGDEAAPEGE